MKRYKTCVKAFKSIGLIYSEEKYACYNETLGYRELCPFAIRDTCPSKELPDYKSATGYKKEPSNTYRRVGGLV